MGLVVGVERQFHHHPAGLRTNTLVCVGAALFVALAELTGTPAGPSHMAGYIVTGVGFLGGGVILREGLNIKGLSTAATLWCIAAVGALVGAGQFLPAAVGTLIVLGSHLALRPLGRWIDARTLQATAVETHYRVRVECRPDDEGLVRTILMRHINGHPGMIVQGIARRDGDKGEPAAVTAEVYSGSRDDHAMEELVNRLTIEPGVSGVRWEKVVR
jgi:putative Mg2+ transporter-C (MgtC) family protein